MKILRIKFYLLAILLALPAYSQSVGTTVFDFLKTQYSARGAGMASNLIAIKGDVNAMFYNPAVLTGIDQTQYTVNYVDHLLDLQGGQIAFVKPHKSLGNIGVGLIYFNYGNFEETDAFGDVTGRDFGATDFALAATIANALGDGFDYGVNLKFIYSSFDTYNASGVALDAGIVYTVSAVSGLQMGVSISNAGFIFDNYTDVSEKMPLYLRIGFSKKLAHLPLLFSASLNDLTLSTGENIDMLKRFTIGGEFDVSESLKFRIGYDNGLNDNVKPLGSRNFGGISGGLGILFRKMRLDYAFSAYGDLGSQNRIGLTGSF